MLGAYLKLFSRLIKVAEAKILGYSMPFISLAITYLGKLSSAEAGASHMKQLLEEIWFRETHT